ncbi:MAG: LCP family protein [Clostridia bacterium]|nr:LCP family protein [Clostridia bacterium]
MRRRIKRTNEKGKLLLLIALVAALFIALYLGGRWLDQRGRKPEARGDYVPGERNARIIEVDGASYRRKPGQTVVLAMGIDRETADEVRGFRSGGQADFLRLFVIDETVGQVRQIAIDRDTVTPITILGVLGDRAGMRNAQISLSHSFGDGGKMSCELTCEAVSNLLLGTEVDYYLALNIDGIVALNDFAGGVTVTLDQDLTGADPEMAEGAEITLLGRQAEIYVRSRMDVGEGTNVERMGRQEQYIDRLTEILEENVRGDRDYAGKIFDKLEGALTTDMSRGRLVNLAWSVRDHERSGVLTLKGTHQVGADGFMTFQADREALTEMVLDVFYEKVD